MISKNSPIRIAIVGCGNVFTAYAPVIDKLRRQGMVELAALCDRQVQSDRAQELGASAFFNDYDQMIRSDDLDAVVILTPMPTHAAMARAALQAGKHVLVEKPLATNLKEGRDLLAVAKECGRYLVCAPFTVLSPTFQAIAARLHRGDIGRVISARGRYGWAGPDWADWFYKAGGGALFDLGVYNLTTLTGWLGPVRKVTAMAGVAVPQRNIQGHPVQVEAEDNVQVLLDFGGSCFASVMAGFSIQQYRGPGLELFGTEGTIYMLGDDWDPDGYEIWQNAAGCWQYYKETHPEWPWTDGLGHLVECIRTQTPPLVTAEHAFHVLEVMFQAQASARDGQARLIDSTFPPPMVRPETATVATHRIHDRTRTD